MRVLWFDDEHETLENIIQQASRNDIELVGFSNAQEGIEELRRSSWLYDAVIIDGVFFKKPGMSGDQKSDSAIIEVLREIDRLYPNSDMPSFILSGQRIFTHDLHPFAKGYNKKVYDKYNVADLNSLWADIRDEASHRTETKLRNQHKKVFDLFALSEHFKAADAGRTIVAILKNEGEGLDKQIKNFNDLRIILEALFKVCNDFGLLPNEFIIKDLNATTVETNFPLKEIKRFYDGNLERGYELIDKSFPHKRIKDNLSSIIEIYNEGSHLSLLKSHIAKVNNGYLLLSVTYQLLDVLHWFKLYFEDHPVPQKNKSIYHRAPEIIGVIDQDSKGNYFCQDYLLDPKKVEQHYKVGDKIRILSAVDNTKRTKNIYPKFSWSFESLK